MTPEPLFELDQVSATRGESVVLRDLDLRLERGATAIVGPSGAGKSTLLRLLNRLADPESGSIRFDGADLRSLDVLELRRRACLVPQLPAPLPGTVAMNVGAGPRMAGRDADVARALGLAGLDGGFADRSVERLSVGEQQRVMLARALALEPEVLLLDEPTAALDEETKRGIERTLGELERRVGISTILVTHERAQARRLARCTVELRAGRAVEAA